MAWGHTRSSHHAAQPRTARHRPLTVANVCQLLILISGQPCVFQVISQSQQLVTPLQQILKLVTHIAASSAGLHAPAAASRRRRQALPPRRPPLLLLLRCCWRQAAALPLAGRWPGREEPGCYCDTPADVGHRPGRRHAHLSCCWCHAGCPHVCVASQRAPSDTRVQRAALVAHLAGR